MRLYDQLVTLEIDHLISCVHSLEQGSQRLLTRHGLVSVAGGRHTGHGTANRIIPLGTSYLETVAVVDPAEAAASPFAGWVTRHASSPGIHGLCLRTDDIDALGRRLDLEPAPMSRERPDGVTLEWRLAGLDRMLADGLPFFIQWDIDESEYPGRMSVDQPNPTSGFDEVVISGDKEVLRNWADGVPGLRFVDGPPGIVSARVQSDELA